MTKTIIGIFITAVTALCFTAGCGNHHFVRQKFYVQPSRTVSAERQASEDILGVNQFSIDSAFRTRSVVYKRGAHEYESSYYYEYLTPPAEMITEQTRNWLTESGIFATVTRPNSAVRPTLTLEGEIKSLYADTSVTGQPKAVMELAVYMLNKENREIICTNRYMETEPMASKSPDDYFEALQTVLQRILIRCETDLAQCIEKNK